MICKEYAKSYCKDYEKIENYELAMNDKTQVWDCHHRNERFYSASELKKLGLYYNCPPCELIFLTKKEHRAQPHKGKKNRKFSDEWKQSLSEAHKGQVAWNKGKNMSDEFKEKCKNRPQNSLIGEVGKRYKGKHWRIVNGKREWYE